jgi:hypothetical protein
MYNYKLEIVGNIIYNNSNNIKKIYIQHPFTSSETEIKLENINAVLVWRDGYIIE